MRLARRFSIARAALAGLAMLAAALLPGAVAAKCGGTDLMAALAREDPAAHGRILARAAEVPNGEGLFWRVVAPGGAVSHLYGTLHSTEAAARWLPGPAISALGDARLVMVELTPEEQQRLERRISSDPRFAVDMEGPGLSERLAPEDLVQAEAVLAERGMSMSVAEKLKPWLLISTISVPLCEKAELAKGKRLLDDAIAAEARVWGIPLRGLESYEETFAAFDELSDAELTGLLVDGLASSADEEDLRRTLETLYAEGRIAAILEFNIWHASRHGRSDNPRAAAEALTRALIFGRNHNWMRRLRPELDRGAVFAAFGALHLPGSEGIVALLRRAGYRVERLDR
ncbi:TraB/GumN family protein [Paralimibaculum aggregatum]|uniref:TraB/GumN family protein n=1 Tax=Paralimibaculum aggregatum TaxID=3036245 RepID=A0ABQ6LRE2_9RHOB|nr:TraB/GumN family protein [Limibaculum sp. NKW23]GMG84098.1 TraB/GumN family protein [Limibaculum sp. NKW23]